MPFYISEGSSDCGYPTNSRSLLLSRLLLADHDLNWRHQANALSFGRIARTKAFSEVSYGPGLEADPLPSGGAFLAGGGHLVFLKLGLCDPAPACEPDPH